MDAQTLFFALLGVAAAVWPAYQLWKAIFSPYAEKDALAVVQKDIANVDAALKAHISEDRVSFITKESFDHHNDTARNAQNARDGTVNRVLDIHEKNISEAHTRVDDLKDAMNKGFSDIKDLLLERLPRP